MIACTKANDSSKSNRKERSMMVQRPQTPHTPNMTDYEAERRNFRLEVPEYFNFATDIIGKWASDPNKLAMLWVRQDGEERHITFAQFAERSNRAANAFTTLGIKKGDRVLVMLPRIPEWWESVLGLMKLGAIPIPCNPVDFQGYPVPGGGGGGTGLYHR